MRLDPVLQEVFQHVRVSVHQYVVENEAAFGVPFAEIPLCHFFTLQLAKGFDHEGQVAGARTLEKSLAKLLLVHHTCLLLLLSKQVKERVL